MKVPTAPKSTEKRPVLASPHPHQKANLRKADDQVMWSYTKSCETRTGHFLLLRGWFIINRDFLFHGLICKLIYGLIDFQQNLTQGMPKKVQFWVPPAENQLGVQETPGKIRRWSDLCCGGTVISMLRRGTFCGSIDEEEEGNSEKKTWRAVLMWWHCIWQNVSGLPEYESNRTHQKKKKK